MGGHELHVEKVTGVAAVRQIVDLVAAASPHEHGDLEAGLQTEPWKVIAKALQDLGLTDDEAHSPSQAICPMCGQLTGIRIIYGLPLAEEFERAERGEIALGGYDVNDDLPDWRCTNTECESEWGREA